MAVTEIRVELSPRVVPALLALADALKLVAQGLEGDACTVQGAAQVLGVDLRDLVASRAHEGRVVLEPSESLLQRLSAVRAGQRDGV